MLRKKSELHIYVFSFNRGVFLRNCLQSIAKCAPGYPTTIVDNGSDDPSTKRVLAEMEDEYCIINRRDTAGTEFKTGGLSANMNYALEHGREQEARFALFIQDDMQLVRTLSDEDINRIKRYFKDTPNSLELHTCFLKEAYHPYDEKRMTPDATSTFYVRDKAIGPGNCAFSDVGVFDIQRFFEAIGSLAIGEGHNERKLLDAGLFMGFYAYPFMAWLPYPIAYRGKRRRLSHRAIDLIAGSGFHPIRYMSPGEQAAFWSRPITQLPVAERFLTAPSAPKSQLWGPGGIENIEYRGGWRKSFGLTLLRVEAALVRRYKRWISSTPDLR